ncbi:MAG TPA: hypothetical protein VFT31_01750 [Kribbella sp.]|nr:hypothetical protein [Kribbella sp.]
MRLDVDPLPVDGLYPPCHERARRTGAQRQNSDDRELVSAGEAALADLRRELPA